MTRRGACGPWRGTVPPRSGRARRPTVTFRVRPQGVTVAVAFVAVGLQVRGDLGLKAATSSRRAPSRAISSIRERPSSPSCARLVADDLQHECRLLPAACEGAAIDQAGGYAAGVTGSTIHNFRSYLSIEAVVIKRRDPVPGSAEPPAAGTSLVVST